MVSGSGTTGAGLFTASATGAVFELPNRAKIHVSPNTVLRVFPVPQDLQLGPGARTTTWSLALMSGRADVEMPRASKHNAVLASLGKLSAVVSTGRVALLVSNGEATVANVDGEVRTMLEYWQTVPLGFVATLSRDNPNATAKPGLPFPVLNGGPRMFFAPSEAIRMGGFRWSPVPGADRYELRLRRRSDSKVIEQRTSSRAEFADAFSPVEPGQYGLSLRSVDARGLENGWSPEAELRVIGVVLPPGGYSTEQAIFLGAGQEVQFTNTSGLEMTYLGAGRYFPAANSASLYRDGPTVVGFRLPGSLDMVSARLEPRGIYAEVQIGPKRALWPRDPVSIDIRLMSKAGVEIPSFLQIVPKVTLGLEPIDVSFEREGNVLHAVVPPSSEPGPWVLRVDVADQFGVLLGHDFLEVAQQPPPKGPALRTAKASATRVPATPAQPAQEPTVASSN